MECGERRRRGDRRGVDGCVVAGRFQRWEIDAGRRARGQESPARSVDEGDLLGDIVRIWPGHAERRDRAHDDRRVRPCEMAIGETIRRRTGRAAIVEDHVGFGREQGEPVGHRPLVRVQPAMNLVRSGTHDIECSLRTDDICTEVGEQLGRVRDPYAAGHFENPDAFEALRQFAQRLSAIAERGTDVFIAGTPSPAGRPRTLRTRPGRSAGRCPSRPRRRM